MAGADDERGPLPVEPLRCRQRAEDGELPAGERAVWALLGIAGELATIRRELERSKRR
ncbi:hypothetical protein [Streptomyces phytophilus]|uniref:hypothetical protein n=1 Tax=Streptomyces phytophilus TaxID=722715 RepID=UPI0015F0A4FE|nr:hypothetical protein [Streptomyces phytophilus]